MFKRLIRFLAQRSGHCPEKEDLFDFVLDGLHPSQRGTVREHLTACPGCREQVKEFALVSEGIALCSPQEELPPGFEERFRGRLRSASDQTPSVIVEYRDRPVEGWPLFWLRVGPAFAVASLLMTLSAMFAMSRQGSSPQTPVAIEASRLLGHPRVQRVALRDPHSKGACRGELVFAEGSDQILVNFEKLHPCPYGSVYTIWGCPSKGKSYRLAGFQTEDEKPGSYLLHMAKPFSCKSKPLEFRVSLEGAGMREDNIKGEVHLQGRYEL